MSLSSLISSGDFVETNFPTTSYTTISTFLYRTTNRKQNRARKNGEEKVTYSVLDEETVPFPVGNDDARHELTYERNSRLATCPFFYMRIRMCTYIRSRNRNVFITVVEMIKFFHLKYISNYIPYKSLIF